MIVRLVKDWSNPDWLRQTPKSLGIWDEITFTEEAVDECDLLVVFNRPKSSFQCKVAPENTWLITQEPPTVHHAWHKRSFAQFATIFSTFDDPSFPQIVPSHGALPWFVNADYDEMKRNQEVKKKDGLLSMISSNLSWTDGHKMRLQFIQDLKASQIPFDLYGRGFKEIGNKMDGLAPYRYSVAIENSIFPHYWTEKLADCFLARTLPFYCGCPNVTDYFPEESLIIIDPTKPKMALETIEQAIANDEWSRRHDAIEEARRLVLDQYQVFPYIVSKLKDHYFGDARKRTVTINANTAPWEQNQSIVHRAYRKLKGLFNG